MPDDEHYWPPITLRCIDCRSFGREVLVGTHTITNVQKYIYVSAVERARRQQEILRKRQQRRQELLDRLNQELLGDDFVPNGSKWKHAPFPFHAVGVFDDLELLTHWGNRDTLICFTKRDHHWFMFGGAKLYSERVLDYCQMDPFEHISVKY